MTDDISVHVYRGAILMGIFDGTPDFLDESFKKWLDDNNQMTTGFHRLDNELRSGADTDGDFIDSEVDEIWVTQDEYRTEIYNENRFIEVTDEMLDLYSRKNTDYGGSFDESLDEDGLLVSKIRMKDKLNRFSQLIDNDALVNDESMRDTLIDLANYAVMTLIWLDGNE